MLGGRAFRGSSRPFVDTSVDEVREALTKTDLS